MPDPSVSRLGDWRETAIVVRLLTEVGPMPHVDGHDCYGFTKLPADELGREYTMYRFSPKPPDGSVTEYDGNDGHWRHVRRGLPDA